MLNIIDIEFGHTNYLQNIFLKDGRIITGFIVGRIKEEPQEAHWRVVKPINAIRWRQLEGKSDKDSSAEREKLETLIAHPNIVGVMHVKDDKDLNV